MKSFKHCLHLKCHRILKNVFHYHNVNKIIGNNLYDFGLQTIEIPCRHKIYHNLCYIVGEGSLNGFILLRMKCITIGHTFTNSPNIKYEYNQCEKNERKILLSST